MTSCTQKIEIESCLLSVQMHEPELTPKFLEVRSNLCSEDFEC